MTDARARPVRVAIGPTEIAGCSAALAQGLRALGVDAEVVLAAPAHSFGYPADRVLGRARRTIYALLAPARRDVFHYQYGRSWVPAYADVAWARLIRRTLLAAYYGDDCRLSDVAKARFPARGRVKDSSLDDLVRKRLGRLSRLCHAALVGDLELATYLLPYFARVYVLPVPLLEVTSNDGLRRRGSEGTPVVLHAPSDPEIKGTAAIKAAVDAVAQQVPLRFRLVTGVPHQQVVEELRDADIVVDQLNSATTGVFALEAMRLGLPVLGEVDPRAMAPFQRNSPVVAVTSASLERELEILLRDPDRRREIGLRGKEFVTRTHDPTLVGQAVLNAYAHLRENGPGLFECTAEGVRRLSLEN